MENKYYTTTILDKLPKECFENNLVHRMLNMIKDNKYYTPSIEEFHVGFEYEYWNNTTDEWCNTVLGNGPISLFFADYLGIDEPDKYRVKYLDREDIESLGFVKSYKNQWVGWEDYYYDGDNMQPGRDYYLYFTLHVPRGVRDLERAEDNLFKVILHRHYKSDEHSTTSINNNLLDGESQVVFVGLIKNKSELRRVLKQVGVL